MIKKMCKILTITFIIFGFTGCTADVSLKFDKNNNVKQTIKISEDMTILNETGITYSQYIDDMITYSKANNIKYKRNDFKNETNFGTVYTKDSKDICKELKTSFFSKFFESMKCKAYDDYYTISAKTLFVYCPPEAGYCSDTKEVRLSIELPEEAIDNDADIVEGTNYVWIYDRQKKGTFNLKFKKYKASNNSVNNNKYKFDTIIKYTGIALIFMLIIGLALSIKYKKNKVKY